MKTFKKLFIIVVLIVLLLFFTSLYIPFPKGRLDPAPIISLRIVDRNNIFLREVLSDEGGRCHWVALEEVSPHLLNATVAAEDKRFFLHTGINFLAITRAFFQNLKHGRIISGASTISQQLVRNIYHFRRNILSKIAEAWLALRLERTFSKEQILIQYINRICYGNQAYGIDAASHLYFDKPSSDLSLAEAAFLAGLPRSPSVLNPYRSFNQAKKRQQEILKQMLKLRYINQAEMQRAAREPFLLSSENEKFRAPHFCDFILKQIPSSGRRALNLIQTTCDFTLQEKIEVLVSNHITSLERKGITNASVIVMDNAGGEILCMVGSKDFFDYRHDGQVNGALSLRQPGSTLKPFTYGLALEKGMTAAEILEDVSIQFTTPEGSYRPRNYDKRYHGPVRLRKALACSYNVPAVSVLQILGSDSLYQRLKSAGFDSLEKSPSHYGIGLTLGNGEVTLIELVQAYSALARGGIFYKEKSILSITDTNENRINRKTQPNDKKIFSPQIAYILTHILSDKDARIPAFGYNSPLNLPFPCAVKTGTTKDFRDNWTIGYTPKYTVGIWVGNFDGTPMHNVSGITGCGPLFRDIMLLLGKKESGGNFEEHEDIIRLNICPLSGKLATAACAGAMEDIFIKGTEPHEFCFLHQKNKRIHMGIDFDLLKDNPIKEQFKIVFPFDGDVFKLDPILRREYQTIKFKASVPEEWRIDSIEWWVNGNKMSVSSYPFSFFWNLKPGFYTINALVRNGKSTIKSPPVKICVLP